jgi:hypothetical protein
LERWERHAKLFSENLKGRDFMVDTGVEDTMLLKRILGKEYVKV